MAHFSWDRLNKYGWGSLRLALLVAFAFLVAPQLHSLPLQPSRDYRRSWRWLGHAYLGAIGAAVNVEVLSWRTNLALLAGGALVCALDMRRDAAVVIYLLKTFCGDFLAGKLDTREWRLVLAFVVGLLTPAALWLAPAGSSGSGSDSASGSSLVVAQYARIFLVLFASQVVCECGDNYLEHWRFFRHRYSYELATLVALLALPRLAAHELLVVQVDLVACWFYRLANAAICALVSGIATRALWVALARLAFAKPGMRIQWVTDPAVATAVMQASSSKGDGVETNLALPAWAPILSLESVDGKLWREMRPDFARLMRACPPASKLQLVAEAKLDELVASGETIDSEAICRLTASVFINYLFDREWCSDFQVFVDASWEWRKEIALKGQADVALKQAAVRCLVQDLLPHSEQLWGLFGERWHDPRYYSLILQPFIISPCINMTDIAVALHRAPAGSSVDDAVRAMHPFPIFERHVAHDVCLGGKVVVPAGTHAIMFPADFELGSSNNSPSHAWSIFGSGPRMCAGAALAAPFMSLLQSKLVGLPQFQPERGHRYSGRNNDGTVNLSETLYFMRIARQCIFKI